MKDFRLIIYAKDVQIITGRSERYARKILAKIRTKNNKQRHQPISMNEFCDYMGLPEKEVRQFLKY